MEEWIPECGVERGEMREQTVRFLVLDREGKRNERQLWQSRGRWNDRVWANYKTDGPPSAREVLPRYLL